MVVVRMQKSVLIVDADISISYAFVCGGIFGVSTRLCRAFFSPTFHLHLSDCRTWCVSVNHVTCYIYIAETTTLSVAGSLALYDSLGLQAW